MTLNMGKSPMTKRLLMLLIYLLGVAGTTLHAEGGCPSGMVPEGGPGASSCRPLPGYNQNGAAAPAMPRITWISQYGAVAMDTTETGFIGASHDKPSRADAERIAMQNCLDMGAKKCELLNWYANGCVALAKGPTRYGVANGNSPAEAGSAAVTKCSEASCKVVYGNCSQAKAR